MTEILPRLLDDHAHPFPLTSTQITPADLSLSVDADAAGRRAAAAPHRLMLELLTMRLAGLLGCDPQDVRSARAEAARDWPAYLRRLFDDAGIDGMLLDGGMSPLSPTDLPPYADTADIRVWSLLRLEAVIDPLLEQGADGPTIASAVEDFVSQGARAGAAGLKTVLAYRTGLAVDPAVSVEAAYRSVDEQVPVRRRAKALRDHLFRRTLSMCADLGLPLQVHTGFGDSDIRLAESDPVLLDDALRTPEGGAAPVVLIHAGFPWHEKLAYLTVVRTNVWAELSLVNLFSPVTTAERLLRLLDLAPADRLLLGTDGHGAPETHWFAAHVLRDAWAQVRQRLDGQARSSWLDAAGERLFHANAEDLYALTD